MLAVEDVTDRQPVVDLASYADDCMRALAEALDRHGPPLVVRELGACRGMDIDVFFPARGQSLEPARSVCQSCAVALECGTGARGRGTGLEGVWAGESARQRRG